MNKTGMPAAMLLELRQDIQRVNRRLARLAQQNKINKYNCDFCIQYGYFREEFSLNLRYRWFTNMIKAFVVREGKYINAFYKTNTSRFRKTLQKLNIPLGENFGREELKTEIEKLRLVKNKLYFDNNFREYL